MSIWKSLELKMDKIVDRQFAEPVEFHPYTKASYSDPGSPDPARSILKTTGIYVNPGAAITGEGGTQGANLNFRLVMQDCWISIIGDYTSSVYNWVRGDRVYLPERGEWWEITYIDLSPTNRPNIHLVRLQIADVP